jgi:hypothetical protein
MPFHVFSENAIAPACSARSLSKIVRKSPISPYGFMPFTLPPIILQIDVSSLGVGIYP